MGRVEAQVKGCDVFLLLVTNFFCCLQMIMDEVGTEGGWALMTVQMEIGGVAVRMSRLLMTGTMIAGGRQ